MGVILTIFILLTLSTLFPFAAAETPIDAGALLSEVKDSDDCIPTATASGTGGGFTTFISNPVNVTVAWTIEDECGQSSYGFRLTVQNLDNLPEIDQDDYYAGNQGGPLETSGTLNAQVDGTPPNRIQITIYCNVTHETFDEDEDKFTRILQ